MLFRCPGCDEAHIVYVEPRDGPAWGFNGDLQRPTFTPSILVTWEYGYPPVTAKNFSEYQRSPWEQETRKAVCHSFVTDGQIQFLDDCTHALAGKTVPLPVWDQSWDWK